MICGFKIWQVTAYPMCHFIWSAFWGSLGYSLTLTMLLRINAQNLMGDSYISTCALLAGVSFAMLSHVMEYAWLELF